MPPRPSIVHKPAYPTFPQLNLAGVVRGSTLLDTTSQQLELTLKINVVGAHNIVREFLPHSKSFRSAKPIAES